MAAAHGPAILDDERHALVDKVVAVVGIPPRTAAPKGRGGAGCLVMVAKAIGILPVPLTAVDVVVVVRIAIEDEVPSTALGIVDEQPRPEAVMEVEQLEGVVARTLGLHRGIGVIAAGPDLTVGDLESLEVHPAPGHEDGWRVGHRSGRLVLRAVEKRHLARIRPNLGAVGVRGSALRKRDLTRAVVSSRTHPDGIPRRGGVVCLLNSGERRRLGPGTRIAAGRGHVVLRCHRILCSEQAQAGKQPNRQGMLTTHFRHAFCGFHHGLLLCTTAAHYIAAPRSLHSGSLKEDGAATRQNGSLRSTEKRLAPRFPSFADSGEAAGAITS